MRVVITILSLVCWAAVGLAQTLSVSVAPNPGPTNRQIQVKFTLEGTHNGRFQAPADWGGLSVYSGPAQSTNTNIMNGQVTHSKSWTYAVYSKKEGSYTIGPAKCKVGDKVLESKPITLKISDSGAGQKQPLDFSDQIFIRCHLSKANVFEGEQITATYKVYTQLTVVQNDISTLPSFNGFWSQEVDLPAQATLHRENVNGQPFNVATLKQVVLFPQRSGTLEIDPLGMDLVVQVKERGGNNIFDRMFGKVRNVPLTVTSQPVAVEVKPLPAHGKPPGFTGMVGDFTLESSVSKSEVAAHESVNLKIKVSGKGNLKLMDTPHFEFPPDFETYDPELNDRVSVKASGVSGSREYDFLLIPRHGGHFEIEPFQFSWFNPKTEQYYTIETPPYEITVTGAAGEEAVIHHSSKSDVQVIGSDIRHIMPAPANLREKGTFFFGSGLFYGLMAVPMLGLIILLLVRRRRRDRESDTAANRSRGANKLAVKRLAAAKKCLDANNSNGFYEEVFRALYGWSSDKLNIPVSGLTKEHIAAELGKRSVSAETVQALTNLLERCEMARFAPMSDVSDANVYQQAIDLIGKLEGETR